MRYLYLILVFVSIVSCRRISPLSGKEATFRSQNPTINTKTVAVPFEISYDSLFAFTKLQPAALLFDAKKHPEIDFPLTIRLLQKPSIQVSGNELVRFILPVQVDARPTLVGINTGLIQAKAQLNVAFRWNWKDVNHRSIDDEDFSYSWIAKPEMRVLGFPVQVHGIVDPLLQKQIPSIRTRLVQEMNQAFQLPNLSTLLNRIPRQFPSDLGLVQMQALAVDVKQVEFSKKSLHGKLYVQTALQIGDAALALSPSSWVEMKNLADNSLPFMLEFPYERLEQLISQSMKLKSAQLQMKSDTSGILVSLSGFSGAKSTLKVYVKPVLLSDNRLAVSWSAISISGVPFYLRGIAKHRIEKEFRLFIWKPENVFEQLELSKWGLHLTKGQIQIQQINYTPKALVFVGEVNGNWELKK